MTNALSVECPTCEAPVWSSCVDGDGFEWHRPHSERIRAADSTEVETPKAFREWLECSALGPRWVLDMYAGGAAHVLCTVSAFGRVDAERQIRNVIADIRTAHADDTPFFAALLDAFGGTTR